MRIPCIQNNSPKNTKISDICWNANGKTLAVAYYVDDHNGPCSHTGLINFLSFDSFEAKTFKGKAQIEMNSCIRSISPHPKNPNIYAAASYLGEISLINLEESNKDDAAIKYTSPIDSYFHKECVINVKWIKYDEGNYVLILL